MAKTMIDENNKPGFLSEGKKFIHYESVKGKSSFENMAKERGEEIVYINPNGDDDLLNQIYDKVTENKDQ